MLSENTYLIQARTKLSKLKGARQDRIALYFRFITTRSGYHQGYVEKHHILPHSLGGSDDDGNMISLTAREHYIAHLLLAKATNHPKMIHALHCMMFTKSGERARTKINSHIYQYLMREHSKIVSAYSLNTVTAYDQEMGVVRRIPKQEFNDLKNIRYVAVQKGVSRPGAVREAAVNTMIPYDAFLHGKLVEFNHPQIKLIRRLARQIFWGEINYSNKTKGWHKIAERYCKLFGVNVESLGLAELMSYVYFNLTIEPKQGITTDELKQYFSTKKRKSLHSKIGAQKSRASRSKHVFQTPKGLFTSPKDLIDAFPEMKLTNSKIQAIIHNRVILSITNKGNLPVEWIGKRWSELGFTVEPK